MFIARRQGSEAESGFAATVRLIGANRRPEGTAVAEWPRTQKRDQTVRSGADPGKRNLSRVGRQTVQLGAQCLIAGP
jgi:hypothetical protein